MSTEHQADSGDLHRFFAVEPLLVARHKRGKGCGMLVAIYEGHVTPCDECPPESADNWHLIGRCRCTPAPALPDGAELATLIERARSKRTVAQRNQYDDAVLMCTV